MGVPRTDGERRESFHHSRFVTLCPAVGIEGLRVIPPNRLFMVHDVGRNADDGTGGEFAAQNGETTLRHDAWKAQANRRKETEALVNDVMEVREILDLVV